MFIVAPNNPTMHAHPQSGQSFISNSKTFLESCYTRWRDNRASCTQGEMPSDYIIKYDVSTIQEVNYVITQ